MDERNFWLGFSVFSGIGPMKFKKLLTRFGTVREAWQAPGSHLAKLFGVKLAEKFDHFKNKFSIEGYVDQLDKKDVSFIILKDNNYPELLRKIKNPPFVLYYKGNVEILRGVYPESDRRAQDDASTSSPLRQGYAGQAGQANYIAVVGTRRTTQYGREVTKILTQDLVVAGFTIVSGLAIGIDAISHKTAIENGGKTIAVLGSGVDCCNPVENLRLYNDIIQKGSVVISELPLGHPPTKGSFPSRNRIIAGLSMGVLVTEGAEDSGSLITADYATKFGRKVFAVPGPITSSLSKGPYKLIEKGAKLVTSAEDILKEFKIQNSKVKSASQNSKVKNATEEERKILEILRNEPLTFDEIVRRTGFESAKTGSILSVMEIKGLVKDLTSGQFSIAS